jgi:hypothetical protein
LDCANPTFNQMGAYQVETSPSMQTMKTSL